MNRKDILTDFCVYLLLTEEESYDNELYYFHNKENRKLSYKDYIETVNKFIEVEDFLWDTVIDEPISKIHTLTDLISDNEIEFLQDYIKHEFYFGFDTEIDEEGFSLGGKYGLDFTIDEIHSNFQEYLSLKKINADVYITYYKQFINFLNNLSNAIFSTSKKQVDNFLYGKKSVDIALYSQLKVELESNLKSELLKKIQIAPFQVQGHFDNRGLIFNYQQTFVSLLEQNSEGYELNLEIEPKCYFVQLHFNYYLFKIKGEHFVGDPNNNKELKKDFEKLRKDNRKQINHLEDRGFNSEEIDTILNCFSLNKFDSLGIRHFYKTSKIYYFNLFYFFYRFEYLIQEKNLKFTQEEEFNSVPICGNIDNNQYKKYMDHSKDKILQGMKPHKNYPFRTAKKLLDKIAKELFIDLSKLNLPDNIKQLIE